MRIRRPRNLSNAQIVFATIIGVLGGVYIWQPLLLRFKKEEFIDKPSQIEQVKND